MALFVARMQSTECYHRFTCVVSSEDSLILLLINSFIIVVDEQVEPEGTSELPAASKALFLDKVRQSNAACQSGDYATAVSLYTDALHLDPSNHILYSNRSAALVKMGQFSQALQDAIRARELNNKWPKVQKHKVFWTHGQEFACCF